jgi:acyl carrier protein
VSVSVEQRVIEIVCEHLLVNKETVTRSTSFQEDIGADSLDIVELVMELEEEFDIVIPRRSRPSAKRSTTSKPSRRKRPPGAMPRPKSNCRPLWIPSPCQHADAL